MRPTFARVIFACTSILVCGATLAFSQSGGFPPLGAGIKLVRFETVTIAGSRAGGSDLFLPTAGTFRIEYSVQPGKEILITMLTQAQYRQIAAGRKPTGTPLIRGTVRGNGLELARIGRGNYVIAFNNQSSSNTSLSYRASFAPN